MAKQAGDPAFLWGISMKTYLAPVMAAFAFTVATPALANASKDTATFYENRSLFSANLGSSFTDGYDSADYGIFYFATDYGMSVVKQQTQYHATGFNNVNIVNGGTYCAGCNGSFVLDFTKTSYGSNLGVFGVGLDYVNDGIPLYTAFVTYGDGSTENRAIPYGFRSFFGVSSSKMISSIAFGLPDGAATREGYFSIDNLTIGRAISSGAVPEPATWALFILGFGAVAGAMRRRQSFAAKGLPAESLAAIIGVASPA